MPTEHRHPQGISIFCYFVYFKATNIVKINYTCEYTEKNVRCQQNRFSPKTPEKQAPRRSEKYDYHNHHSLPPRRKKSTISYFCKKLCYSRGRSFCCSSGENFKIFIASIALTFKLSIIALTFFRRSFNSPFAIPIASPLTIPKASPSARTP